MSKPIIIYNKKDIKSNITFEFLHKFYSDIVVMDNYDLNEIKGLGRLNDELLKLKEKHTDLRLLFFLDISNKEITKFISRNILYNYRLNLVLINVQNKKEIKSSLQTINKSLKGSTVFGWLIGDKDSDKKEIDNIRLIQILHAWLILFSSGSLSGSTGEDTFYEQQNERTYDNHLLVLKSKIFLNSSLSGILASVIYNSKKLLEKYCKEKKTLDYYDFHDPFEIALSESEKIEAELPPTPTLRTIGIFKTIEEFEEKAIDIITSYETDHISPLEFNYSYEKSSYFKNLFAEKVQKAVDSIKSKLIADFANIESFNFTLISNYLDNTREKLKEKIGNKFLLAESDLFNIILRSIENEINNIIKLRKEIEDWKGKKEKKRLTKFAYITAAILFGLEVLAIHYFLSFSISLNLFLIELLFSAVISVTLWIYIYFKKLKILKQKLKREIRNANNKIQKSIKDYVENIPFRLKKFLKTHWEKKIFNYLWIELRLFANAFGNLKNILFTFVDEINLMLSGEKKDNQTENIDISKIFNLFFHQPIQSLLSNINFNSSNLKNDLIEKLFQFVKNSNLTFNLDNIDDYSVKFDKQAYPIEIDYLVNLEEGKTSPEKKGKFIIKPENLSLKNAGVDKIHNTNINIAVLIGEYYSSEL